MRVVPYDVRFKQDFIDMNLAWISEMFEVEPEDIRDFESVDNRIDAGAQIFFALDDDDTVMSCCMIAPLMGGEWEIMKFATKPEYAGRGIGRAVLSSCIDYARSVGAESIIIVSNTICVQAIHLYRDMGFTEISVDPERFPFNRLNIALELVL